MKIKTLNTYGLLFGFLFLFNIVAGGIIPLGIEPLKDSIKMIIFFVDVFALFILKTRSKDFMVTIYYFLVVGIILFISLYGSVEINYALEKVDAILWCVPLSTLLLLGMHRRFGLINTLDIIIKCGVTLLILTLIYKIIFGFWDRNIRFFLNGANVFGWLMGFYFLISLFIFENKKRILYILFSFLFFLGVLWSESKGALLSSLLGFVIIVFTQYKNIKLKFFMGLIISCFILFNSYLEEYLYSYFPNSRLLAIFRVFGGDLEETDQGSIGTRSDLFLEAYSFFLKNPISGIGLGNFKAYSVYGFDYPHNAHLEVFTENGLFIGIIYLLFIAYGLFISKSFLRIIIFYFLLVCTFSGDLGYLRFAFIFILLSICINKESKKDDFKYSQKYLHKS